MIPSGALTAGREAFARRAWSTAYAQLAAADASRELEIDDIEHLAMAAYLAGLDERSHEVWVRAHADCLRAHDVARAARCSFWVAVHLIDGGEPTSAHGWVIHGRRLLDEAGVDAPARGLLEVLDARQHIRAGDLEAAEAAVQQAAALARRFEDPELRVFSRLIRAQVLTKRSESARAAEIFDELMIDVALDDVPPIAVGVVYCAAIETCLTMFDLVRARAWTSALSRWCDAQAELVPFRGQCLVHRTEFLRLDGAWPQALVEAERACRWITESMDELARSNGRVTLSPFIYPAGPAFYQLGELHRLRGHLADAEAAYRRANEYGYPPEPGLALLRLAQGRRTAAAAAIRRALAEPHSRPRHADRLAAAVEILIEAADLEGARSAAEQLAGMAGQTDSVFLSASASLAAGRVRIAEGDVYGALVRLREAWMAWQQIDAPWQAACVRTLRGVCCRSLGDAETADLEFEAAQRIFERLGASPDLRRVATLRAGRDAAPGLSPRERQIIELVAGGKTNRAIAARLGISERTVDRHVSNILTKLNLPSRAAATAYACRHGLL